MFEDFNNATRLTDFRVFDDLFFEICWTYFLHMCSLLYLLSLIKVLQFAVKEFLNQLVQVLSNLVEENDFSVLVNIWIRVVLFALLSSFFISLSDQWLSRFESFPLFRVYDNDIREDFRELLSIEKLGGLLLVSRIIDVKGLSIILKNLFEFTDISWHVKRWRVHEKNRLTGFPICIFELPAELLEIWIKCKLHIESSWKALVKDTLCEFLSLNSSCRWKQSVKLLRLNKGRVQCEFIPTNSLESLQVVEVNVFLHVLLEAVDERGLVVSVELSWLHPQLLRDFFTWSYKQRVLALLPHKSDSCFSRLLLHVILLAPLAIYNSGVIEWLIKLL